MITLSFREQVFLILLAKSSHPEAASSDLLGETARIVSNACDAWGHVPTFFDLSSPGPMTIMNPDKTHNHTKCVRCGKVIE